MAFKNAMNKASLTLVNTPKVNTPTPQVTAPAPALPIQPELAPRIEHVVNKNKFNVYFAQKPADEVLTKLRAANFWWNAKDKCWFNKDCPETRDFLERTFNADLSGVSPAPKIDDNNVSSNQTAQNTQNGPQNAPQATKTVTPLVDLGLDDCASPAKAEEQHDTPDQDFPMELERIAQERHRQQVKELLEAIGVTPGVLMELAIDMLHRATFDNRKIS